ncbi:ADP-ribose pyrophosphatase YjhB (NUDIX family) [Ancylobacter sp. 3268]|uniref:NUDIX hydrolase n=1 Tax=Ancylobacter sp. 3268 TaxID=2817752 RepID=UPI0028668DE1|nr:NUDIX hydrolase [Ancylobacter sp. 3268]MDR6951466.1 ADP-ribose pyrophosphatase YjhB (NUDIX family) [Ancylobacter sp. 3268]
MTQPPIRPVLAISTAVFRDGQVLLARRGAAPLRGLWSLPGGRLEPGETLAEGAAREVMEEVGVACRVVGVAGALDIIRRDDAGEVSAHFVVVSHAGLWLDGEPATGPEAAEVGWFDPHHLPDDSTEGLAGIVAAARALVTGS